MVKTLLLFIMNTLQLTPYQLSVIVGLLLRSAGPKGSDGMLSKRNTGALAPKGGGAPPPGGALAGAYFSLTQTCNPNNLNVVGHVQLLFLYLIYFRTLLIILFPIVTGLEQGVYSFLIFILILLLHLNLLSCLLYGIH